MPGAAGELQAVKDERATDAARLSLRGYGERTQKEGRPPADPHWPVAHRADQHPVLVLGDEAKLGQGRHTVTEPIGCLRVAIGAEAAIEKLFDGAMITGAFRADVEHDSIHSA